MSDPFAEVLKIALRDAKRQRREIRKTRRRHARDLPPGLIPNLPDCVFCQKILNQECEIAGPGAVAFEPLNPVVPGHVLVIPIVHASSARSAPRMAGTVMTAAVDYANKKNYPDCNFITSSGLDATQTVFHYHMHIVPRHEGDGLRLPWTDQDSLGPRRTVPWRSNVTGRWSEELGQWVDLKPAD